LKAVLHPVSGYTILVSLGIKQTPDSLQVGELLSAPTEKKFVTFAVSGHPK
jgi:hypothetical protein